MRSQRDISLNAASFFWDLKNGYTDSTILALKAGLSPHIRNEFNVDALNVAVSFGSVEVAKALIAAGANVNEAVNGVLGAATTPLHRAFSKGDLRMMDILLTAGADAGIADGQGRTVAHALFFSNDRMRNWLDADPKNYLTLLERFLTPSFPINHIDRDGRTVLDCALRFRPQPLVVERLLKRGADPKIMNAYGKRALHRQWIEADIESLSQLVKHGADINARDAEGASPLFYADDVQTVDLMLSMGADIHHVDDKGRNALAYRIEAGRVRFPTPVAAHLVTCGVHTDRKDHAGQSVESRLQDPTIPAYGQLLGFIHAHRAKAAMSQVFRSMRHVQA